MTRFARLALLITALLCLALAVAGDYVGPTGG
jgi:hypothetical protein